MLLLSSFNFNTDAYVNILSSAILKLPNTKPVSFGDAFTILKYQFLAFDCNISRQRYTPQGPGITGKKPNNENAGL